MATEKIARQGLTVRHVGVVVTMALTLLTAVGIVFGSRPMLQASIATLRRSDITSLAIHHVRLFGPMHRRCPNGKTVRQVQR